MGNVDGRLPMSIASGFLPFAAVENENCLREK